MPTYTITKIEGDGIGPDLMREGRKALAAVQDVSNLRFDFVDAPSGGRHYLQTGQVLPYETVETCRKSSAVYKSPIGLPNLPQGLVEQGMLLPLRQELGQYVNLRPTKVYPELVPVSHMRPEYIEGVDFVVVRENSEGLYSRVGGLRGNVNHKNPKVTAYLEGLMKELGLDAIDASCYSQRGVDRILIAIPVNNSDCTKT